MGNPTDKVKHTFSPLVKSSQALSPTSPSGSVIHHKVDSQKRDRIIMYKNDHFRVRPYGVSSSYRVLTKGLFFKHFDRIREYLKCVLGLTAAETEVALRLLRFFAYYGVVYPKAAQLCQDPGCSRATFWRTIRKLESRGLIRVVNRYILRPHAQISNLYNLLILIITIARYLAEHGPLSAPKWIARFLRMPAASFWSLAFSSDTMVFDTS